MKHHHGFGGSARRRPPFDLPDQGEHFRAAFGPFAGPGSGFGPGHDHDFDRMWMGHGGASRLRSARAGRGGRGRRGDVRAAILALLSERPMHGYEMLQELAERTQGLWRPSPGSLYPALQLLEDQGLVQSVEAEGRRRYELTDAGSSGAGFAAYGAGAVGDDRRCRRSGGHVAARRAAPSRRRRGSGGGGRQRRAEGRGRTAPVRAAPAGLPAPGGGAYAAHAAHAVLTAPAGGVRSCGIRRAAPSPARPFAPAILTPVLWEPARGRGASRRPTGSAPWPRPGPPSP